MRWRADHDAETTDWRAVCGRTARTVRRAGRVDTLPDPYHPPALLVVADSTILHMKNLHSDPTMILDADKPASS